MIPDSPPQHVLQTFGLANGQAVVELENWDSAWRVGETVISLVADHARAAWSAKVRETLSVEALRVARPTRSSDGRYVVSGWRADSFIAGTPEPRHDEVLSLSVRLHEALAKIDRPRFLIQTPTPPFSDVEIFNAADRSTWEEIPLKAATRAGMVLPDSADSAEAAEILTRLAKLRKPVTLESQLVHGNLSGTVFFAGAAAPGITDITPYWRPASWASALVAVDAMSWGGADDGLAERWSDLPELPDWEQMLLHAVIFRLAVHALHPRSSAGALVGLKRTADIVRMMVYSIEF